VNFFKAICAEVVISSSDSETYISLSNKVAWVGSVYWLYERKCYLELEARIRQENVKSVLLLGTPGMGKSLFMKWLNNVAHSKHKRC
jgi:ABC-type phosphate transport system ATPase subunit